MCREIEYLDPTGRWTQIPFENLSKGDKFRIWEHVKGVRTRYTDGCGNVTWEANIDPYRHPIYGIWTIKVKENCHTVLWDNDYIIQGKAY